MATHSVPARTFVGLQLDARRHRLFGALVRLWGFGLQAVPDVVAAARVSHPHLEALFETPQDPGDRRASDRRPSGELAELAAAAIGSLLAKSRAEPASLRAVGLLDCGSWRTDSLGTWDFQPQCDTALLAKLGGMTVIDDFPGRDRAHGGRGGPCAAAGIWLLLADRGVMPGRMIRAVVDLDAAAHLFLLPPRQAVQLPGHLSCVGLGPALALLDAITARIIPGQTRFDPAEQQVVQARKVPDLLREWDRCLPLLGQTWSPLPPDTERLLACLDDWSEPLDQRPLDVLCTAIHWVADRIASYLRHHLPRSQPVGQLILAGPLRHHAFLVRQLKHNLPELEISLVDHHGGTGESWQAIAAALLACLHVDQIPTNSYALTGTDTPRILGRITPGPPGNWHRVLADMAQTLPEKMTLRSAI